MSEKQQYRYIDKVRVDANFVPKMPPLVISVFWFFTLVAVFAGFPPICVNTPNNNYKVIVMVGASIFFLGWIWDNNKYLPSIRLPPVEEE